MAKAKKKAPPAAKKPAKKATASPAALGQVIAQGKAAVKDAEPAQNTDFARQIPMAFKPRAGVKNYQGELLERLKDVRDRPEPVVYILPVALTPLEYEALILEAARLDAPDWTEGDELKKLIKETDSYASLSGEKKA